MGFSFFTKEGQTKLPTPVSQVRWWKPPLKNNRVLSQNTKIIYFFKNTVRQMYNKRIWDYVKEIKRRWWGIADKNIQSHCTTSRTALERQAIAAYKLYMLDHHSWVLKTACKTCTHVTACKHTQTLRGLRNKAEVTERHLNLTLYCFESTRAQKRVKCCNVFFLLFNLFHKVVCPCGCHH